MPRPSRCTVSLVLKRTASTSVHSRWRVCVTDAGRHRLTLTLYNVVLLITGCLMTNTTHFGYETVAEEEKVHKVAEVFHSVAAKYDVMNDFMSAGLHRVWKAFTIAQAGIRPGFKVL